MRDWRAVNGLFLVSTFLEGLAFGHTTAYMPLFLAELGLTPAEISAWTGLLYAAMTAVAFPLAPFWGAVAERYSRRLVIVRSQYLAALAYLLLSFAPNVWVVLVARILLGLTFGNIAVVIATQAAFTPKHHLGMSIATIQAAMPVAASIGPPVGAVLIEAIGLRGLFLVDTSLALIAALLVTFLMPEPERHSRTTSILARTGQTLSLVWRQRGLRWNFLCWLLSVGARAVVEVYLPVRITEIAENPAPAIGFILGVSGIVTAVSTLATSRLVDDHGGIRWFVPSMLLATVVTCGIAVAPNLWVLAALTWIRALPFAAANTILYAHLTRVVPPVDQTAVLSLTPMPRNTAMFLFPIAAAAIAPFGVSLAIGVGAAAYLGAVVVGWLTARVTPAEIAARQRAHEAEVGA
ncbi:MAG: MFS transporter [Chloroflexi bacterium]|nr:MFS transporter [Chloroflexota bacterium]